MGAPMSPELAVMRAPMRGYARLVNDTSFLTWGSAPRRSLAGALCPPCATALIALRRPALVAVILGAAMAIGATGHVTLSLWASTTACWSFATAIQLAVALAVIGVPARRVTGVARGLDLFFAGHAPWSLWLLAFAAWTVVVPPLEQLHFSRYTNLTALIPLAWTARLVYAFHVQVLRCAPWTALRRTLLHQALTWGITILLVIRTVVPRAAGILERWLA